MSVCDTPIYCDYDKARRLPTMIINYLKKNAPNFWKILKYEKDPYSYPDLSAEEINAMVCDVWTSDAVNKFPVIQTRFTSQALSKLSLQFRVSVMMGQSPSRSNAQIRVMLECVCAKDTPILKSLEYGTEDRAFALTSECIKSLNGAKFNALATNLNLDTSQDRNTGVRAVEFSETMYGFSIVFSTYII